MTPRDYRPEIDGLRAVAIVPVLLYHVGFSWMPGGFVGVDVFFVISGYLITLHLLKEFEATGTLSISRFYLGRVRRLGPAMLATIGLSFVAAYFIAPPQMMKEFAGSAVAALLSVSNVYFWNQAGYFDTANDLKPLLHTWSLAVEEQFYLLWPMLLLVAARRSRTVVVITLLAIFVASLGASIVYLADRSSIYYLLPFRAFELALGGLVVFAEKRRLPGASATVVSVLALGLIGLSLFLYDKDSVFPSYAALLPCVGAALVIYAGRVPVIGALLSNHVATGIGKISYSLYLVHWPIIVFYRYKYAAPGGLTPAEMWALCAASVGLATALYFGVEQPFRRRFSTSLAGWRSAAAAGLAGSLMVVPASAAWSSNGWSWRYAPEIQRLLDPQNYAVSAEPIPVQGCFMLPHMTPDDIAPSCYTPIANGRPNILLLGDSTVFHLLSGLQARLHDRANLLVWSGSSCVPVKGDRATDHCDRLNKALFERVLPNNRYDLVIVATIVPSSRVEVMSKLLPEALESISGYGTPYAVLGQPFVFSDAPINLVARHGVMDGLGAFITRAALGAPCRTPFTPIDKAMPKEHFFSYRSTMCRDGEVIFSDGAGLLHQDVLHLSERGSVFFADRFIPWLEEKGLLPRRPS